MQKDAPSRENVQLKLNTIAMQKIPKTSGPITTISSICSNHINANSSHTTITTIVFAT